MVSKLTAKSCHKTMENKRKDKTRALPPKRHHFEPALHISVLTVTARSKSLGVLGIWDSPATGRLVRQKLSGEPAV